MKKITPIALVALFAFTLVSCKKEYSCECTGSNGASGKTEKFKATKKDAKASCENVEKLSQGMLKCTLN